MARLHVPAALSGLERIGRQTAGRVTRGSVRIAVLLALLVALNAIDLWYTLFAHQQGMLHEQNPIARHFTRLNVPVSLISFKILMLLISVSLLWRLRKNRLAPIACWLLVAVYVGLAVVWLLWLRQYAVASTASLAAR